MTTPIDKKRLAELFKTVQPLESSYLKTVLRLNEQATKNMPQIGDAFKKTMESLNGNPSLLEMTRLGAVVTQNLGEFPNMSELFKFNNPMLEMAKGMSLMNRLGFNPNTFESIGVNKAFLEFAKLGENIQSMAKLGAVYKDLGASAKNLSSFMPPNLSSAAFDSFKSFYDGIEPENLLALSPSHSDYSVEQAEDYKNHVSLLKQAMSRAKNFYQLFNDLAKNHIVGFFMVMFLVQLCYDIGINVLANMIASKIQEMLIDNNKPTVELVSDIKKIPACEFSDLETAQLRFVTNHNVFLYDKPKMSVVVERVKFSQVLVVLQKNKNWLEVSYKDADGEELRGWVLTRYTARFIK